MFGRAEKIKNIIKFTRKIHTETSSLRAVIGYNYFFDSDIGSVPVLHVGGVVNDAKVLRSFPKSN